MILLFLLISFQSVARSCNKTVSLFKKIVSCLSLTISFFRISVCPYLSNYFSFPDHLNANVHLHLPFHSIISYYMFFYIWTSHAGVWFCIFPFSVKSLPTVPQSHKAPLIIKLFPMLLFTFLCEHFFHLYYKYRNNFLYSLEMYLFIIHYKLL